jgi:heterodisulfide reductase subunit A
MAKNILICRCPDLAFDAQALAARLGAAGVEVRLAPPLCTPEGLKEWTPLKAGGLLGACGPEVNAGLFEGHPVVDLLSCRDLEAAAAAVALAWEAKEAPAAPGKAASGAVLVVGGGVGGCQAALDLANAGFKVYLAETSLSIGGTMAQLDKTFPTLDCSICILGPKLVEVATHPGIELLSYARLDKITGEAGCFEVDLTLRPRYVNMAKCVGCGSCAGVCPVIVPSRWNLGLKPRKAIRIIFAQAVPLRATIERDYCLDCQMCVKACEHQAINLLLRPASRRLEVGAIVLATGARPFDPGLKSEYGYGRVRGVVTSLEFERLVCASGPTLGSLVTAAGRPVRKLAFVQCAGSRDRRFLSHCSGFCCTASLKQAMLALEHEPGAEVTIFYNDLRLSGKGFEDLYHRARQAGVRFVKALPGKIEDDRAGGAVVRYEDQATGRRQTLTVDLAVLAVGLQAPRDDLPFAGPAPELDAWGFYQGRHPVLEPQASTVPGVFLAGTCQGPRDISETVCTGSAAAARVMRLLGGRGQGSGVRDQEKGKRGKRARGKDKAK